MRKYTAAQRARDWQFVFASQEGRRAIADLFKACGLFGPSIVPGDRIDPLVMAFNEGRRNVALDIVQALHVAPEEFRQIAEAMKETDSD